MDHNEDQYLNANGVFQWISYENVDASAHFVTIVFKSRSVHYNYTTWMTGLVDAIIMSYIYVASLFLLCVNVSSCSVF